MASDITPDPQEGDGTPWTPGGGTRAEAIHRLQMGLFGLGAIVLVVGLANVVIDRAKETDATAVMEASDSPPVAGKTLTNKDPLADAGVVPDLPSKPVQSGTPTPDSGRATDASAAQP